MKIVVCIKQVPDSAAKIVAENGKISWGDAPLVINPWDEYAVEAALLQAETDRSSSVTALSIGGEQAAEALKHALAMGCKEAILVSDAALAQADSLSIAQTLAAAIRKIGDVDLVVFGRQAIDGDSGLVPVQTARLLGYPILGLAASLSINGSTLKAERTFEESRQQVESKLPAVVSVVKDIGEPRYPSFMGIRKAAKAQIPVWKLSDLGLSAPQPVVRWSNISNPPEREGASEIISGASAQEIAEKLADKILAEKVL